MGKRRKGGQRKKPTEPDYDSDDPRAYEKDPIPNRNSREFLYDEVDEFHANKEKILLNQEGAFEPADSSDNEEEVLGWNDDDDDDDEDDDEEEAVLKKRLKDFRRQEKLEEMASDLEDEDSDDDEDDKGISAKAWGKRKQQYYDTDYVDDDLPGLDEAEEAANQDAEEKEALAIQARMAETLEDEDFGLDILKPPSKQIEKPDKDTGEERVIKDLSKLSKREKLEILKKESPEFLELTSDFKVKMKELTERLQPLVDLAKSGVIKKNSPGAQYVHTKYQLYLSYCMNISFYMILKTKHIPVTNHPVIGRILTFRKLISELQPIDDKMEGEITTLLEQKDKDVENRATDKNGVQSDEDDDSTLRELVSSEKKKRNRDGAKAKLQEPSSKKKSGDSLLTEEELRALEYYKTIEALQRQKKASLVEEGMDKEEEDEEEEDGKRGITYQISKNKGLTTYKRKELRNPRVKHRMKFRKAVIRRKGQVRAPRTEMQRYGGEASGIRAGVIKSVKIK